MRKEQSLTDNKDTVIQELVLGNLNKNIINQIDQFSILSPGTKLHNKYENTDIFCSKWICLSA